jgi:hypothetical protein
MAHQKEAGVFTTVSTMVDQFTDNPAAILTAQEILQRLQKADQARAATPSKPTSGDPCTTPQPAT